MMPVTFATSLTDEQLRLLAIARIQGERNYSELEPLFSTVVAEVLSQFPTMGRGPARQCARLAIDTEAAIRWIRTLEGGSKQ